MFAVVEVDDELKVVADNWLRPGAESVFMPPLNLYMPALEARATPGTGYSISACRYVVATESFHQGYQYIMSKCLRRSKRPRAMRDDPDYEYSVDKVVESMTDVSPAQLPKKKKSSTPNKLSAALG